MQIAPSDARKQGCKEALTTRSNTSTRSDLEYNPPVSVTLSEPLPQYGHNLLIALTAKEGYLTRNGATGLIALLLAVGRFRNLPLECGSGAPVLRSSGLFDLLFKVGATQGVN